MIPRLTLDPAAVRNITLEQFELYRDYYTLQMSKLHGRRGALTAKEIKEDIVIRGRNKLEKLFRRQCKVGSTHIQDNNNNNNAKEQYHIFKYEDREIYYMLKANARGRRQSIASSICL